MGLAGCGDARVIAQHQKALASLGATARFIGEAWLQSRVTDTYARTAFHRTLLLVEEEHTAVASDPRLLATPAGAQLSHELDAMARLLAGLMHDVDASDGPSAKQHLAAIQPSAPGVP